MADFHGQSGDDIIQQAADSTEWVNYYGEAGNDIIRARSGNLIGGSGNDTLVQLDTSNWWEHVMATYWDGTRGAVIDLQAGTAQDGWGGVDTLVGIQQVHGGGFADVIHGNAADNLVASGGGNDTIDGREGLDTVVVGWVAGAPLTLETARISVSVDGRSAIVTATTDPNFRLTLSNVERIQFDWNRPALDLGDFIDPAAMATQALVGANAQRWNMGSALGTPVTVTYSFVKEASNVAGFRAFTAAEQAAVAAILDQVSAVTRVTFALRDEAAGQVGQLRFGVSEQAATKGQSAMPGAAEAAGDVWMDTDSMANLAVGTEGYQALLHEIGHALGLRHPRNTDPGDQWALQWRAADDATALTVMSGTASPDGLFRADFSALDIAALRSLYGTRAVNAGDDLHAVGGSDAQAQRAIIDDGGTDTLSAAGSPVSVRLDLTPGHRSSVGVTGEGLVSLDNLIVGVDTWLENAVGSDWDDVLIGNARANRIAGGLGNDWVDGGDGLDFAVFAGNYADYAITHAFGYYYVTARDGHSGFDTLVNVERLEFADTKVAIDIDGIGGQAYRLYQAAFDRVPDLGGLGYQMHDLESHTLAWVATNFIASPEFQSKYGNLTDPGFVTQLYRNVLHREPADFEVSFHVDHELHAGYTRAQVLTFFSESPENKANVIGAIENGMVYTWV